MKNEQDKEQRIYIQIECKKENPPKWGWYNTDRGNLFWYESENNWSCNDERLSEEYPKYWYKQCSNHINIRGLREVAKEIQLKYFGTPNEHNENSIIEILKQYHQPDNKAVDTKNLRHKWLTECSDCGLDANKVFDWFIPYVQSPPKEIGNLKISKYDLLDKFQAYECEATFTKGNKITTGVVAMSDIEKILTELYKQFKTDTK